MTSNAAWFNDPYRNPDRILQELAHRIDLAPAGSTIRGTGYSVAHPIVVDALVRAERRGVDVVLCLDGRNRHFPGARRAAAAAKAVTFTRQSARGTRGVTHSKFWLFDHDHTVVLGSSNITRTSTRLQWSSMLYLPEHSRLHDWLADLHGVMMHDRPQVLTALQETFGGVEIRTCPRPQARETTDPILADLERVEVEHHGRTLHGVSIRAAWHGYNDHRGIWVSEKLADMAGRGADVRVICGKGTGRHIPGILRAGGVQVRRGVRGARHIHWKHYAADYTDQHGHRRHMVSDGSENCSDQSLLRNDETQLVLWRHGRIAQAWHVQYDKVWDWSSRT